MLIRPPTTFRILLVLGLLGIGGGFLWFKSCSRGMRPVRVMLVAPAPDQNSTVSHYQVRALALLMQDILEANPQVAVTVASEMPEHPELIRPSVPWVLVKLQPQRQQDKLDLVVEWAWNHQLGQGPRAWQRHESHFGPPEVVFPETALSLPLDVQKDAVRRLVPRSGKAFWSLVQASTLRLQNIDLPGATKLARAVVAEDPEGAAGWFTLGSLIYRQLLDDPKQSLPENLRDAESCFGKGLDILPWHPRGTFLLAQLRTNSGGHRESLSLLLEGLKKHPRNPLLLTGVVYAARNAGLLDLARRAADRRDNWAFTEHQPQTIDVLFLYLGDLGRFEVTLRDQPGHLRSTVQRFYRGFLALLRNHPVEAIEAFRAAESVPRGYPHYIRLSRAFRLAAEDKKSEANAEIQTLEADHTGLRVPDGEFTLRMAEAYGFAGNSEAAMDLAERAFAQGFGATAWFEKSPFLLGIQGKPRWKALIQHLRERQALLESRFPSNSLPPD